MATTVSQAVYGTLTTGAGTNPTAALGAVTAGQQIIAIGFFNDTTGSAETVSCADSVNGSYGSPILDIYDSTNQQRTVVWRFASSAGGTPTITVTVDSFYVGAAGIVIDGSDGAAPTTIPNVQQTPGTATDGITSTNLTPTSSPGRLVGFTAITGSPTGTPATGTGFASEATGWTDGVQISRIESKSFSSTSADDATFTANTNVAHTTFALAFYDAATGPQISTLSPADDATGVSTTTALQVVFDQNIQVGTGDVRIVSDTAPVTAPTVQARNTDAQNTNATTFTIDIPGAGSIQAGDLAIIAVAKDDNEAPTGTWPPTGWDIGQSDATGATHWSGWIYRWCDGSTDGTTVTLTESTENWISRGWLIRGADPDTNPVGGTVATGTTAAANPPSVNCPGGTEPHLILYYVGFDGNSSASAHPGGYSNTGTNTTTDATTGNRCGQAYGELASTTAGSDDPGALTNTNEDWKAFTIAIRPKWTRTTEETIDITDAGQVSISSATLTITPTPGTLDPFQLYHIEWDAGIVEATDDSAPVAALADFTTWSFTTGAAPVSGGSLRTQQRARGFPPRAPLPGISRIGAGVLVGISQPSFPGTASAATSSFAVTATGTVTHTGSASAAFQPFAVDAVGAGVAAVLGAPFASPQPITFSYPGLPGRVPSPPRARLGLGLLVPSTPQFTYQGSGDAAFSSFAVTASGLVTFTGTGSAALQPFAIDASGTETFAGSASAALAPFACSASGVETFAGSGSAACQPFAADASGTEAFSGTGSAACQPFGVDVTGVAGDGIGGSGSAALAPFAVSASGLETFTGTASAAAAPFACSATGTELFTGSASAACQPFGSAGNGATGDVFFGPASAALSPFATTSTGAEAFSGSGSSALSPFASDAAGTETFTGTGTAALTPFACSASGTSLLPITGTASCAASPFGVDATGLHILPITGTADAALSPFACTAAGVSGNIHHRAPIGRVAIFTRDGRVATFGRDPRRAKF